MKQDAFVELLKEELISSVQVTETTPTKGKPLDCSNLVWRVSVTLLNGNQVHLISSRGGVREWASLDRLNSWLKELGILQYKIQNTGHK